MTNEPSRSVSHKILWNRPGRLPICGISGRKNVTKILRFLSKIKARTYSPRQQTRYRKKYRLNIDPSALLQSKVSCAPLHCFVNYTIYRRQCQYRQANFFHKNRILKNLFFGFICHFSSPCIFLKNLPTIKAV